METERASRQKAEKDLLEMEKQIGSLRVDVSEYEQRAADITQKLAAETDKVGCQDAWLCSVIVVGYLLGLVDLCFSSGN